MYVRVMGTTERKKKCKKNVRIYMCSIINILTIDVCYLVYEVKCVTGIII